MPDSGFIHGDQSILRAAVPSDIRVGYAADERDLPEYERAAITRERRSRHAARPFRERQSLEGAAMLDRAHGTEHCQAAEVKLAAVRAEADQLPAVATAREKRDGFADQVAFAEKLLAEARDAGAKCTADIEAALAAGAPVDELELRRDTATATASRLSRRLDALRPLLAATESNLERERAKALPPLLEQAAAAAEAAIRSFDREEAAMRARHSREWLALPWSEKTQGQLLLGMLWESRTEPEESPEVREAKRRVEDLQQIANSRFAGAPHRFLCSLPGQPTLAIGAGKETRKAGTVTTVVPAEVVAGERYCDVLASTGFRGAPQAVDVRRP